MSCRKDEIMSSDGAQHASRGWQYALFLVQNAHWLAFDALLTQFLLQTRPLRTFATRREMDMAGNLVNRIDRWHPDDTRSRTCRDLNSHCIHAANSGIEGDRSYSMDVRYQ